MVLSCSLTVTLRPARLGAVCRRRSWVSAVWSTVRSRPGCWTVCSSRPSSLSAARRGGPATSSTRCTAPSMSWCARRPATAASPSHTSRSDHMAAPAAIAQLWVEVEKKWWDKRCLIIQCNVHLSDRPYHGQCRAVHAPAGLDHRFPGGCPRWILQDPPPPPSPTVGVTAAFDAGSITGAGAEPVQQ